MIAQPCRQHQYRFTEERGEEDDEWEKGNKEDGRWDKKVTENEEEDNRQHQHRLICRPTTIEKKRRINTYEIGEQRGGEKMRLRRMRKMKTTRRTIRKRVGEGAVNTGGAVKEGGPVKRGGTEKGEAVERVRSAT